jgi:hypothetical protein
MVLGLFWCNTVIAGKGASCALVVDKATRHNNYISFNVYNPTDKQIIITGIKYYKGGTFWREYSDIYQTVAYKRNKEFVHNINTTSTVSYNIQCYEKEDKVYFPKKEKKSSAKKFLEKIFDN